MTKLPSTTLKPIPIPRFLIAPGRVVHLLSFELSNQPGALADILQEFARAKLNVLSIWSAASQHSVENVVEVVAFVDFTGAEVSAEEIAARTREWKAVPPLKIVKQQFPGITFEDLHFPLTLSNERVVLFREPIYGALIHGLREKMGSAAAAMLYYAGSAAGEGLWKNIKSINESVDGSDEQIPELIRLMELAHGRGRVEFVRLDVREKRATLTIHDSFECSSVGRRDKPYSALYRGLLAGLFGGWLGHVDATETRCIAVGDPYCEMEFQGS